MKRLSTLAVLVALLLSATVSYAVPITYVANLGDFENPKTGSAGTGLAVVTIDTAANTLRIEASFSGLGSPTLVAHIHCCVTPPGTVGVAVTPTTLPGFPTGVTSGTYAIDLNTEATATYTPAFVSNFGGGSLPGAESALAAGLATGQAYFNIHTTQFTGGEIRQFLSLRVPEPSGLMLILAGIFGLALARKFRSA